MQADKLQEIAGNCRKNYDGLGGGTLTIAARIRRSSSGWSLPAFHFMTGSRVFHAGFANRASFFSVIFTPAFAYFSLYAL
jgi:hypothetical protein